MTGTGEARAHAATSSPLTAEEIEYIDRLGRALGSDYEIGGVIGQGGFGRVYTATDVRLGRVVAIKVIRPELAGARAFLDRMRKEGTALAKFRHPGIIPIYDIREHEGLIFYIMPLIQGDTLRAKLEKTRALSPKMAHRILTELTECLSATHKAGIVHRDIKPDNVILEGTLGRALLMDFGIAKSMKDLSETGTGLIMGTPTYMSPEQATGDGDVDHRSDIYSLGVLGYHMLTGRPPFIGSNPHSVIAGHVSEKPTPIRKLNPSVPLLLARALERCLEKAPEDRYQSASELAGDLLEVSFLSDAEPAEPPKRNFAMPFFAGVAAESAVYAYFGRPWMWALAGGFGAIAVFVSPVVRAVTEPMDADFRKRLAAARARLPI